MNTETIGGRTYIRLESGGVTALYELRPAPLDSRIHAVLLDLDGTSLDSEKFWVGMIEETVRSLTVDSFRLAPADIANVTGYTTREHLQYCIDKYHISATVAQADELYHRLTEQGLTQVLKGERADAFIMRKGLRDFLTAVRHAGFKTGLVTSGLLYKARPELAALSRQLGGELSDWFDAVITGGERKTAGRLGTIGELAAKPHPWLYVEIAEALGIAAGDAVVIEDSASGVIAGRLAGFPVLGFNDGTIRSGGAAGLTAGCINTFDDALRLLSIR